MELPEIALRLEGPNAGSSAKKWSAGRKKLETLFSLLGPISQRAAASRKKAEEAKQLCEMREKLLKNEYAAQKARTEKEKLLKKESPPLSLVKGHSVMLQNLSKIEWNGRHGTILKGLSAPPTAAAAGGDAAAAAPPPAAENMRYRVKLARKATDADARPIVVTVRPHNVCAIVKMEKTGLSKSKSGRYARPNRAPRSIKNAQWDGVNAIWHPGTGKAEQQCERQLERCAKERGAQLKKVKKMLEKQTDAPRFVTELVRLRETIMRQRRVAHKVACFSSVVATAAAAAARKAQAEAQVLIAIVAASRGDAEFEQSDIDRLAKAAHKRAYGERIARDDAGDVDDALLDELAPFLDGITAVRETKREAASAEGGNTAADDDRLASANWNEVEAMEVDKQTADFLRSTIVPTMAHQNRQCHSLGEKMNVLEGELSAIVRKAYKRCVAKCHPDRLGREPTEEDVSAFEAVQLGNAVLKDAAERNKYLRATDKLAFLSRARRARDAESQRMASATDVRSQRKADARRRADERAEEAFNAEFLTEDMDEETRDAMRAQYRETRAAQTQQIADATPQRMRAPALELAEQVRVDSVPKETRALLAEEARIDQEQSGPWCSHDQLPSFKTVRRRRVRVVLHCPASSSGWADTKGELRWEVNQIAHATGEIVQEVGLLAAGSVEPLPDGTIPMPPFVAEWTSPLLIVGRQYTFKVRALNTYGGGPWSFDSDLTVEGNLAWADMESVERARIRGQARKRQRARCADVTSQLRSAMRRIENADSVAGCTEAEARGRIAAAQASRAWNSEAVQQVVKCLKRLKQVVGYPHCVASSDQAVINDADAVEQRVKRSERRSTRRKHRHEEKARMKPVKAIWVEAVAEAVSRYIDGTFAPEKAWQCLAMFGRMAHQTTLGDIYDSEEAVEWNADEAEFRYPCTSPTSRDQVGDDDYAAGEDDPLSDDEDGGGGRGLAATVRRDVVAQQQQELVELVIDAIGREAKHWLAENLKHRAAKSKKKQQHQHQQSKKKQGAKKKGGTADSASHASISALARLVALVERISKCQLLKMRAMNSAATARLAAHSSGDARAAAFAADDEAAVALSGVSASELHFIRFLSKPQRSVLTQLESELTSAHRNVTQRGNKERRKADQRKQFEQMQQSVQAEVDEHVLYWDRGQRFGRIVEWVPESKLLSDEVYPEGEAGDLARLMWQQWGLDKYDGIFDGQSGDIDDEDDDEERESIALTGGSSAEVDMEDVGEWRAAMQLGIAPLVHGKWSSVRQEHIISVLADDARALVDALEELTSATEFEWLLRDGHRGSDSAEGRLSINAAHKAFGSAIVQQLKQQSKSAMQILSLWQPDDQYARRRRLGAVKACRR